MPMKPMPASPILIIVVSPCEFCACVIAPLFQGFRLSHEFGPFFRGFRQFLVAFLVSGGRVRSAYYPAPGAVRLPRRGTSECPNQGWFARGSPILTIRSRRARAA